MTDPTARELRATNGHVVPLNGLELYFETSGSGRALILLHGGLQTIDLTFGPLIASLAQRHQVIGVELQGHGHSTDREGPMKLGDLADDVVALLDHLAIERADIFGFSLGGLVAMTLGLEPWKPMNSTRFLGSGRRCIRWCSTRPPVTMPLDDTMIAGYFDSLIFSALSLWA